MKVDRQDKVGYVISTTTIDIHCYDKKISYINIFVLDSLYSSSSASIGADAVEIGMLRS